MNCGLMLWYMFKTITSVNSEYLRSKFGLFAQIQTKNEQKWVKIGMKTKKIAFTQYMRSLRSSNVTKWLITLRYNLSNVDNPYSLLN